MFHNLKFSLLVTSYTTGRFSDICRLLDSIENQTYRGGIEVVFVVDQSVQLLNAIQLYARQKNFRNFNLRVLFNKGEMGVNVCRNLAILASEGEILGIIDDDIILFPNWVERTIENFLDDNLAAMTGPAFPFWEDPVRMSWFPQELYFVWGCTVWNWDKKRDIRNVGGMNCSFRRKILLKAGLYKPGIGPQGGEEKIRWFYPSGEEVELCLRVRKHFPQMRIIYDPSVKVYHKAQRDRFNILFIIKRIFRFGYSKNYVRHLFRSDNSEAVLNLEEDYIKSMLISIPKQFFESLFREPDLAFRRLMMVTVGCLSAGFGYVAYEMMPYHRRSNVNCTKN
jgi:glucosyl-dolichyl phosphate glucuronosyltransferase